MKRSTKIGASIGFLLFAATVLVPTCVFVGCTTTGITVRTEILLPSVQESWTRIEADIQNGIILGNFTEAQVDSYLELTRVTTEAVQSGNLTRASLALSGNWPILKAIAVEGIEIRVAEGDIISAVGSSLLERVERFDEAVTVLGSRLQ